jgi:branched-chain amino acid transport system permease protein
MSKFVALIALLAAGRLLDPYYTGMLTEVIIFGLFAMSLDLLVGYTGLVSFGHAAFFGIGAYAVVTLGVHWQVNVLLGLLVGVAAAAFAALLIGAICIRGTGVGFLMLTMAFSQLLYSLSLRWRAFTGGSDGMGGMDMPTYFGLSLNDPQTVYYLVLICFIAGFWLLRRLVGSPFGHALIGIRENEQRMRAIGFSVQRLKLAAFIIAGAIAGLAGGLYAIYASFVSSDVLFWARSGEALVMVVLGGAGTLVGPVIGAAIFLVAKNLVSSYTQHWLLIIGSVFVACVLFFRRGIYGTLRA